LIHVTGGAETTEDSGRGQGEAEQLGDRNIVGRIIGEFGIKSLDNLDSSGLPMRSSCEGKMSDDRQEMETQPMLEALLDRLQSLETRLEIRLVQTSGAAAARFEQLIASLRTEINENFSRVRDEIAILNDDTLKTRAGQRELLRRVEELESKVL
jgi:BMFP domain-containing protein YqiC